MTVEVQQQIKMGKLDYLNFDLAIDAAGTDEAPFFRARVLESPAGQAEGTFNHPFSALELENFYSNVTRLRPNGKGLFTRELDLTQRTGARLFESVFTPEIYGTFRAGLNEALRQGMGLRIRLRINSPELAGLPWEFLYNPRLQHFLSLSLETPIVRFLDLTHAAESLAVQPPLNLLALISNPSDAVSLDVEHEWSQLQQALSPLEERGLLILEKLERASLPALQARLRQGDVHILHFIGHGRFDPQTQDGRLLLETEQNLGRPISGAYLGALLANHPPLRLVVLNACEGARSSQTDPYSGAAQSLVQQGIPAVVAMQYKITDQASIGFAREFYGALADGYPVDGALVEARAAIFAQENDTEWGTPVYFTRAPDGHIFELQSKEGSYRPVSDALQSRPVPEIKHPPAPDGLSTYKVNLLQLLQAEAAGFVEGMAGSLSVQVKPQVQAKPQPNPAGGLNSIWLISLAALIAILLGSVCIGSIFINRLSILAWLTSKFETTLVKSSETAPAIEILLATFSPSHSQQSPLPELITTFQSTGQANPTSSTFPEKIVDPKGIEMLLVPAGEFLMGSLESDTQAQADEFPQHPVYLDAFYMDRTEVTNAMFANFIQATGFRTSAEQENWGYVFNTEAQDWIALEGANWLHPQGPQSNLDGMEQHPVTQVSYYDARAYCEWRGGALPTESQWEKAARGDKGQNFPWGNQFDPSRANYCDSDCPRTWRDTGQNDGFPGLAPVGAFPLGASPHGLLDMAGNVWEWVQDNYLATYYRSSPYENPNGPSVQPKGIVRGGAWDYTIAALRTANRQDYFFLDHSDVLGFRCVIPTK